MDGREVNLLNERLTMTNAALLGASEGGFELTHHSFLDAY
jgi:hypothetical protein